jgi:hypothetical protein
MTDKKAHKVLDMRKRTVLQYLSLTDFLDHSLSAYVKASLGEKLICAYYNALLRLVVPTPRCEAVMIGGTPKTPRRRPGEYSGARNSVRRLYRRRGCAWAASRWP